MDETLPAAYSIDPKSKTPETLLNESKQSMTPTPMAPPPNEQAVAEPPPVGATPTMPPKEPWFKRNRAALLIIFCVILVGSISTLILLRNQPKPEAPPPTVVVVTPTLTPTPIRIPSALATQSAFMKFDSDVTALSTGVQNYSTEDPSLSPPVLDLPLGFSQ